MAGTVATEYTKTYTTFSGCDRNWYNIYGIYQNSVTWHLNELK